MSNPKVCPWCGMISSVHASAWTCGSFPGWDGSEPHQSLACVEIVRLKGRVEKLEAVADAALSVRQSLSAMHQQEQLGNPRKLWRPMTSWANVLQLTEVLAALKEAPDA